MTLTLNFSPLPFLWGEDGKDDEQKRGGKVKGILVTCNKLIAIYEVFKNIYLQLMKS